MWPLTVRTMGGMYSVCSPGPVTLHSSHAFYTQNTQQNTFTSNFAATRRYRSGVQWIKWVSTGDGRTVCSSWVGLVWSGSDQIGIYFFTQILQPRDTRRSGPQHNTLLKNTHKAKHLNDWVIRYKKNVIYAICIHDMFLCIKWLIIFL